YVVLEVTSEGIKQHRHQFINFQTAVFTNLTKEHIESHGSFENYKKAKGKLFKALKSNGKMIINSDDPNADYFLGFKAREKMKYGLKLAKDIEFSRNGMSFKFEKTQFNLNLIGKFNIYNVLAAISVGLSEKIPLNKIKLALENIKGIPGRMEFVVKEPFTVIVDYAHTPDALEKVYQTIKESFPGKIIGILGAAGGGRDGWKRLELGKIAEKYLDKIIITNEDPYDESPKVIIDEIANGLKQKQPKKILDRRQAIHYALEIAQLGDVVIITGKGCEPWMCVAKGKKVPWDDRKVVKEELC
ncbi:MAG: UDP-N-acetylmuramyl-tripeptide synthetase, partial [Parcubacteria group bacterium]|nr:UDP-N-acetylmuramyl-tripeptide synthetase [Parcubacteria group bacterium]